MDILDKEKKEEFNYKIEDFQIPDINQLSNIELLPEKYQTDLFIKKVLCFNVVWDSVKGYWVKATSFGSFSTNISFLTTDWVLSGSDYILNVNHNLNSYKPVLTIYEGVNVIYVNQVEIIDNNNLRLHVTSSPDLRFNGSISIIKV